MDSDDEGDVEPYMLGWFEQVKQQFGSTADANMEDDENTDVTMEQETESGSSNNKKRGFLDMAYGSLDSLGSILSPNKQPRSKITRVF
jgi:hypothetical protein